MMTPRPHDDLDGGDAARVVRSDPRGEDVVVACALVYAVVGEAAVLAGRVPLRADLGCGA
jgi:hypothetical protein